MKDSIEKLYAEVDALIAAGLDFRTFAAPAGFALCEEGDEIDITYHDAELQWAINAMYVCDTEVYDMWMAIPLHFLNAAQRKGLRDNGFKIPHTKGGLATLSRQFRATDVAGAKKVYEEVIAEFNGVFKDVMGRK